MKNVRTAAPASISGTPRIAVEWPAITHAASKNRRMPITSQALYLAAVVFAPSTAVSGTMSGNTSAMIFWIISSVCAWSFPP